MKFSPFRVGMLVALAGCALPEVPTDRGSAALTVHPGPPTQTISPGLRRVSLPGVLVRVGYLFVPSSYEPSRPMPLVVALHGAGITADGPINLLSAYAEESGFLLLSVESQSTTWDAIYGPYGLDLRTIEGLLDYVFDHCAVDQSRIVLEGFSDGASYALGVGLANGQLFTRLVAFSPGFIPATSSSPTGHPQIFISHGRQDQVLPIEGASRLIVPALQRAGYEVTYFEFDGGHGVPTAVLQQAVPWLMR